MYNCIQISIHNYHVGYINIRVVKREKFDILVIGFLPSDEKQ